MEKAKRISISIAIALTLIIILVPLSLGGVPVGVAATNSAFKMQGSTLVGYIGSDTDIKIPTNVEKISKSAFEGNTTIQSIDIPASVKSIESYAFWGCQNLKSITGMTGLTEVGDMVFANCAALKEVTLPNNIKYIGIMSFADCVNLTDITIPYTTVGIHDTAFDGDYKLTIHYTKGSNAEPYALAFATKLAERAEYEDVVGYSPSIGFYDKDTYKPEDEKCDDPEPEVEEETEWVDENIIVTLADGTRFDSEMMVEGEQYKTLGSTYVVGNQAVVLMDNHLQKVYQGDPYRIEVPSGTSLLTSDIMVEGVFKKKTIIYESIIADQAYYNDQDLVNVQIPEGVESIGQFAFARSKVSKVYIPTGVEDIGFGAFYHCDDLEYADIPKTVMNVEPKAFKYTKWINDFLAKEPEGNANDFLVSGGVLLAYKGNEQKVDVPVGVRVIAAEAFEGHEEIKVISFPDSLRVIGEDAFNGCRHIYDIQLNEGLTDIKDRAFYSTNIKKISIPESVVNMGLLSWPEVCTISYLGQPANNTHELSAERLSNMDMREYPEDPGNPGIVVTGLEGVNAELAGADRLFFLHVAEAQQDNALKRALLKYDGQIMPSDICRIYDVTLSDLSGIELTKLGKQTLNVFIPVDASISGSMVDVITMDRNGQLEKIAGELTDDKGIKGVSFSTNHLSLFGFYMHD